MRLAMSRLFLLFAITPLAFAEEPKKAEPVAASVESTLKTSGGQIRQFAFDGDPSTYFVSDSKPTKDDHLTLVFDKPVILKSLELQTGRPKGEDALTSGRVELSADGKSFKEFAKIGDKATFTSITSKLPAEVKAIRIVPGELSHALVIRDIKIDSDPPVATFKYPVEFVLDVSDAPDMKDWIEKAARVCEKAYPMINEALKSDGFKPATVISMTLKKDYKGVAATGGSRITGSVKYFQDHPDDLGAMIHETVHVVQRYRTRNSPGWLVEGVADYIRFFKYEPGKIGRLNAERAKYDGSYRVTAAFLNYTAEKYDKELVKKLNKALREGEYKEELWKELTKKTVQELGEEWKSSLKK
jgi:Peptidase of plants and bacteria/F5/8 type C domain